MEAERLSDRPTFFANTSYPEDDGARRVDRGIRTRISEVVNRILDRLWGDTGFDPGIF